jgi:hypothetical protein
MGHLEHYANCIKDDYKLRHMDRPAVHRSHPDLLGFGDLQIVIERHSGGTEVALASRGVRVDDNVGRGPYGLGPISCCFSVWLDLNLREGLGSPRR